jgi:maltose/moltooligosaccharide transporter
MKNIIRLCTIKFLELEIMTETKANLNEMDFLPYEPRMKPSTPDSLSVKRTIFLSFAFFIVLLAWSYFNFKVPLLLNTILMGNPYLDLIKGFVMAIDNIVAVFLQPYFGDLSDRTKSKIGRRMPYIVIGTLTSVVFFVMIPFLQFIAGFILIVFLFDVAMSIFRSASIAILPDYTSQKVYSKGSAIQQFIANLGGLLGFGVPIILGTNPGIPQVLFDALGFIIIGALMVVLLGILLLTINETPTGDKFLKISDKKLEIDPNTYKPMISRKPIKEMEKKGQRFISYRQTITIIRGHRDFAFFLATVFFMYLAFASVESFFSSFAVQYIGITEPQAATLFIAYSGPMVLVAYFVGLLGQWKKVGRRNAVKLYLIWLIISVSIMAFFVVPMIYKNYQPVLVIIMLALTSMPWMGFIVISFSILWALTPEGKKGIYTGIYYTFNQAAYALAPVIFGGTLTSVAFLGDYRYIIMFPFILVSIAVAFLLFLPIKGGEVKE